MGKLETTLEEANEKVSGFTADLDEAKDIFRTVGVDLTELDLDSVSDVVEKLKENREGLGEVLDNLKSVDVSDYINQAKRIDWKQLLSAAEEIMGFIQARSDGAFNSPTQLDTSQIKIGTPEPEIDLPEEEEEEDLEWVEYAQPNNSSDYTLMQEEEPVRTINIPKPQPRLKREKKLSRDPKPRLSLRRD
jgi:predicted CopG family antitoxin